MSTIILKSPFGAFDLEDSRPLTIGRKGYNKDIEIDDASVSRAHGTVKIESGKPFIKDTGSLNGILVNQKKIEKDEWIPLEVSDTIEIGSVEFVVVLGNDPRVSQPLPPSDNGAGSGPVYDVVPEKNPILYDANLDLKIQIKNKGKVTVGRSSANDIVLQDSTVSRSHAVFTYEDGQYWVEDLKSLNKTFVNGKEIESKTKIADTDRILISLYSFNLLEGQEDLRETRSAVSAMEIKKVFSNGKVGLQPLSVEIPAGNFVALMGPSGCGKSTLLKCLNGDGPATSGKVLIHGMPLYEQYNFLKRKIGYVPQDDIIHKELTVYDTLYFSAKLRLPDDTSDSEINDKIDHVIRSLNLNQAKNIKSAKVGELSGGQRKRISIAVELLNEPTILFLDEPTSPLDPETIDSFLDTLKKLAHEGTTIIMVTHKPEDLNYVDKVIFMMTKGYITYYGPAKSMLKRFDVKNIVEVYAKLSNIENEQQLISDYYIKPTFTGQTNTFGELKKDPQKSLLLQLYWLMARYLKVKLNDRNNLLLLLAQPFIIAGLVSLIFKEFQVGVLFLMAISGIWFGVSNSAKEIVGELPIYRRERGYNLNIHTYIFSKWAVLSLIALVQAIVFVSIIYLKFSGQEIHLKNYVGSVLFMFYISISASLIGLLMSSYFNTTEKVMTVVPIALMPQIMLAGVITKIDNVLVEFLSFFMLGRWGTEGFARMQDKATSESGSTESVASPAPISQNMDLPEPEGTLAMDMLGYYNKVLIDEGKLIGQVFNSMEANLLIIGVLNIVLYFVIYQSLKQKDTL